MFSTCPCFHVVRSLIMEASPREHTAVSNNSTTEARTCEVGATVSTLHLSLRIGVREQTTEKGTLCSIYNRIMAGVYKFSFASVTSKSLEADI